MVGMRRFNVGDYVVVAKIIESTPDPDVLATWNSYIGRTFKIIRLVEETQYELDVDVSPIWYDEELDYAKNYIVTQILKDL